MTHIAGYGLLAAIIVLYHRAGTALWTDPPLPSMSTASSPYAGTLVAKSVQFLSTLDS